MKNKAHLENVQNVLLSIPQVALPHKNDTAQLGTPLLFYPQFFFYQR